MASESIDAATLTPLLLEEIYWLMGVDRRPGAQRLLGTILNAPVRRFAAFIAALDQDTARRGFPRAVEALLTRFVQGVEVRGAEGIPTSGPLILAANHPGAYDVTIFIANQPREDLKIIASDVNAIRYLPHVAPHFIFVGREGDDTHTRMTAFRAAERHLRDGGAVFLFPTGIVNPDPAISPGAHEALEGWSHSLELFMHRVPETRLVPGIISGVISPSWLRSPLVRIRKGWVSRQKLAEVFEVLQQIIFPGSVPLSPKVSFGQPLSVASLAQVGDVNRLMPGIIRAAQALLAEHLNWIGYSTVK